MPKAGTASRSRWPQTCTLHTTQRMHYDGRLDLFSLMLALRDQPTIFFLFHATVLCFSGVLDLKLSFIDTNAIQQLAPLVRSANPPTATAAHTIGVGARFRTWSHRTAMATAQKCLDSIGLPRCHSILFAIKEATMGDSLYLDKQRTKEKR